MPRCPSSAWRPACPLQVRPSWCWHCLAQENRRHPGCDGVESDQHRVHIFLSVLKAVSPGPLPTACPCQRAQHLCPVPGAAPQPGTALSQAPLDTRPISRPAELGGRSVGGLGGENPWTSSDSNPLAFPETGTLRFVLMWGKFCQIMGCQEAEGRSRSPLGPLGSKALSGGPPGRAGHCAPVHPESACPHMSLHASRCRLVQGPPGCLCRRWGDGVCRWEGPPLGASPVC